MSRFKDPKIWILFISATLLLYFGAFPLLVLAFKSFLPEHIENYALILSKKSNWISLLHTFELCLLTTLFSIGLGLPLAWILSKTDLPRKGLWKSLFTIPYIIPPYIGAIAWLKLLNPTSGSLNLFFKDLFHLQNTPFNIYTLFGAAFVLSLFFYSFILLACTSAFENMDASLEEASRMCGASYFQTLKKIALPLLTPALLSGIILVAMATATAFGVPALLLMPVRKFVLTTKIYTDVLSYSGGIMKAASLSVLLMILGLIGLWLSSLFLKNRRFTTLTGKYHHTERIALKKWKWALLGVLALVWMVIVFLPLSTVIISSFLKVYGDPISLANLSLRKYHYVLFDLATTHRAFLNSFFFATTAATISLVIGAFVAYLKVKTTLKSRHGIDLLATLT